MAFNEDFQAGMRKGVYQIKLVTLPNEYQIMGKFVGVTRFTLCKLFAGSGYVGSSCFTELLGLL